MSRLLARLCLLLLGCALAPQLMAHGLAPALLELREAGGGRYDVLWRPSLLQPFAVRPQLPASCRALGAPAETADSIGRITARWPIHCVGGLAGQQVSVAQLDRVGINVILRLQRQDGSVARTLLDARHPAWTLPASQVPAAVFPGYLQMGAGHLLSGFDHLLFVAGLLLLVRRLRPLLITVTAFTAGHSLTLALATLGWARFDPRLTELAIALSILVLACELARPAGRPPSWLARWPAAMALAFGLLHGLGFAGALAEVGLPPAEIPLALLAFNLGIELGQLALIAGLLALAALWRRRPAATDGLAGALRALPVYAIGTLAAFWCFERAAGLFG